MQLATEEYESEYESKYESKQLEHIREKIELMTKFNQIEVLRILKKSANVIINENKNGIHINLSDLSDSIINELLVYIKYVDVQEVELNNIEKQKNDYKNIFFVKDNKDNMINKNSNNNKYATQH